MKQHQFRCHTAGADTDTDQGVPSAPRYHLLDTLLRARLGAKGCVCRSACPFPAHAAACPPAASLPDPQHRPPRLPVPPGLPLRVLPGGAAPAGPAAPRLLGSQPGQGDGQRATLVRGQRDLPGRRAQAREGRVQGVRPTFAPARVSRSRKPAPFRQIYNHQYTLYVSCEGPVMHRALAKMQAHFPLHRRFRTSLSTFPPPHPFLRSTWSCCRCCATTTPAWWPTPARACTRSPFAWWALAGEWRHVYTLTASHLDTLTRARTCLQRLNALLAFLALQLVQKLLHAPDEGKLTGITTPPD